MPDHQPGSQLDDHIEHIGSHISSSLRYNLSICVLWFRVSFEQFLKRTGQGRQPVWGFHSSLLKGHQQTRQPHTPPSRRDSLRTLGSTSMTTSGDLLSSSG